MNSCWLNLRTLARETPHSNTCRNLLQIYYIVDTLYETFWNFISIIIWLDQHDYVNKASGKFENLLLRRSYMELYTVLFFTDIFKQSIIHYIDEA